MHWEMDGRIDTLKLSPATAAIINQSHLPYVQSGAKGDGDSHNESRNGTESNRFAPSYSDDYEEQKNKS